MGSADEDQCSINGLNVPPVSIRSAHMTPSYYTGPPRQIVCRQDLHCGGHIPGVRPMPLLRSNLQKLGKTLVLVVLPLMAALI